MSRRLFDGNASMNDEDVPFMNYRVWKCAVCERVVALQMYDNKNSPQKCCHCGEGVLLAFVTGGMKGCMLIWNEKKVA
jgi:hypothetical protein